MHLYTNDIMVHWVVGMYYQGVPNLSSYTDSFQALWKKALFFIVVDPVCPHPAQATPPSACGTSLGTT